MADIFLPLEEPLCGHSYQENPEMQGREQNAQVIEAMGHRYHIGWNTGSCRVCNGKMNRKIKSLVARIKLGQVPPDRITEVMQDIYGRGTNGKA